MVRTSVAAWEGKSLVIKTTAELQGQTLTETEHWTLDAAGKTVTKERVAEYAGRALVGRDVSPQLATSDAAGELMQTVVIGGGIAGLAVARDLVLRGFGAKPGVRDGYSQRGVSAIWS